MTKVSRMYDDSIFRYFYVYYFKYFPFRDSYKVLSDKNEFYSSYETDKDENLILMHIMKPHAPYDLDENCKKIDPQESQIYEKNKKYYSYNFKCALQSSLSWSSEFIKKNQKKDNVIIILGDHGIDFNINNNIERDDRNFLQNKLNNVFFASKVPKKCSKLALPKSQVNVMRYILNCIYNTKLEYLDDKQYITRYEDHANYGKVFEFN